MNTHQETEKLLAAMTRAEKAQLLQWVVRDLGEPFLEIEQQIRENEKRTSVKMNVYATHEHRTTLRTAH